MARSVLRPLVGSIAFSLLHLLGSAVADTRLVLERPAPHELQALGFTLDRPAEVRIEAVGLGVDRSHGPRWLHWFDREDDLAAYGWLLDAETRRPVWVLGRGTSEPDRECPHLWKAERSLRLDPGRYELYLWSGLGSPAGPDERGASDADRSWWERLWSRDPAGERSLEEDLARCHVTLALEGVAESDLRRFEVTGEFGPAVMRHSRLGHARQVRAGFQLDRRTQLRAYGIIEQAQGAEHASDDAWIADAETHERVWDSGDALLEAAGGAEKNRRFDETIRLDPGRYVLHYGTDDSHSFERFDEAPPHDPFNWGVTLSPGAAFDGAAFATFDPPPLPAALIRLAPAGDDALFEQPFRLAHGGDLLLQALGEYSRGGGEFADYAWILDAQGRTVWEMTDTNTTGAGGADKNRMFDGLVHLDAGSYVAYYASDDSHAYASWNAATPFEPEAWGLTVRPGPGFDPRDFATFALAELEEDARLLARIVRVGDGQRLHKPFSLDRPTRVRIRALGEGASGEMYDYGRIADSSGRTVWEMSFSRTRHAGGAEKNRECVETIELGPGSYEALYASDDSHSYAGWNAPRPHDALNYGLTIRAEE